MSLSSTSTTTTTTTTQKLIKGFPAVTARHLSGEFYCSAPSREAGKNETVLIYCQEGAEREGECGVDWDVLN